MSISGQNSYLAENMRRLMDGRSVETLRTQMAEAGLAIGSGTIHRAMKGEAGNRLASLEKLATFFGVTVDLLFQPSERITEPEKNIPSHEDDDTQGVKINQFDTGGAMGHGVVLRDQPGVIKSWTVSDSWLQQNVHRITAAKNLCIVTGFGPSMQPLFNPGDPLLVDRGITRVDVDAVYFFRIGTEGFIKQVQRLYIEDRLVLRAKSYNTMYDPFDIPQNGDFEVFGRVVKLWRGEEF
jgi:transcriptional regulator with XRE-family HTH domain